jgi:hypothetical protein
MKLKKLSLGLAVSAAMGLAGSAYAQESDDDSNVEVNKDVEVDIAVTQRGFVQTMGLVLVDSTATAISEVDQLAIENTVLNGMDTTNTASVGGDTISSATGNIGINAAAGDSNIQQNSTAMSRIVSPESTGISAELGYDMSESSSSYSNSNNDFSASADHASMLSKSASHSSSAAGSFMESENGAYDVEASGSFNVDTSGSSEYSSNNAAEYGGYIDQGSLSVAGSVIDTDDGAGNTSTTGSLDAQSSASGAYFDGMSDSSFSTSNDYSANKEASGSMAAGEDYSSYEDGSFSVANDAAFSFDDEKNSSVSASHHDDAHSEDAYDYSEYASFDAEFVFGSALDAETFSNQSAVGNMTYNTGVVNTATVDGNVGVGASGNIGINVAAGSTNAQANQLALATSNGAVSALATASSNQIAGGNMVSNAPLAVLETSGSVIELSGTAAGSYAGGGDVLLAGGEEGDDPEETPLSFTEAGDMDLSEINLSGSSYNWSWAYAGHENTAEISGSTLSGATGNIGLNVAAGSNNLQGNSLAIASANYSNGASQ